MTVYRLLEQPIFPDPLLAENDGLLAVGGDLSPQRLLTAYSNGIFPWYVEGEPILWYALNPRMVLFPDKFKLSKSLHKTVQKKGFEVKFDCNFEAVIMYCAKALRKGQDGTWINSEMIQAYVYLHKIGYAHSVETYLDGTLVGGLYGVSIGKAFFGESMFHMVTDASKVAMYYLVERLKAWDFELIDAQQPTPHLKSLGAEEMELSLFLEILQGALTNESKVGSWRKYP